MQQADLGKQMVQLQKDIKQMSKVKMMTMRVVVMVMVMMDISSKIHLVHMITTMIMTNKSFYKTSKEHKQDFVTTAWKYVYCVTFLKKKYMKSLNLNGLQLSDIIVS